MEIYTTNVTVAQMGAACLGVGSPWTNLSVVGANHALAPNAVPATVSADARLVAFRRDPAPITRATLCAQETSAQIQVPSAAEAIDHLQAIAPDARWQAGRALASHRMFQISKSS